MRRRDGFTLLEMLAVTLLTALVLTIAANFFLEISRQSTVALERTRVGRRSVAALDRLARDLGTAVLVQRPREADPLEHPWLFLGEGRSDADGADRLKFTMRGHKPRSTALHESDLAVVSYVLRSAERGDGFELLRHASPRLPDGLDRSLPRDESEGARVLLEDVAFFGVRFQSEDGEWQGSWDSSTLEESSQLPIAVEIQLELLPEPGATGTPPRLSRRVLLPVRPLDLQTLLGQGSQAAEEEDEEEEGCVTVAECIARNAALLSEDDLEQLSVLDPEQCFSEHASVLGLAVENCDE